MYFDPDDSQDLRENVTPVMPEQFVLVPHEGQDCVLDADLRCTLCGTQFHHHAPLENRLPRSKPHEA